MVRTVPSSWHNEKSARGCPGIVEEGRGGDGGDGVVGKEQEAEGLDGVVKGGRGDASSRVDQHRELASHGGEEERRKRVGGGEGRRPAKELSWGNEQDGRWGEKNEEVVGWGTPTIWSPGFLLPISSGRILKLGQIGSSTARCFHSAKK